MLSVIQLNLQNKNCSTCNLRNKLSNLSEKRRAHILALIGRCQGIIFVQHNRKLDFISIEKLKEKIKKLQKFNGNNKHFQDLKIKIKTLFIIW